MCKSSCIIKEIYIFTHFVFVFFLVALTANIISLCDNGFYDGDHSLLWLVRTEIFCWPILQVHAHLQTFINFYYSVVIDNV